MVTAKKCADDAKIHAENAKSIEESIENFENLSDEITLCLSQKANSSLDNVIPNSEFISQCISWLMPNIGRGVSFNAFPYTAPDDGWFMGYIRSSGSIVVRMAGRAIARGNGDFCDIQQICAKGDTLTIDGNVNEISLYWEPMKGNS